MRIASGTEGVRSLAAADAGEVVEIRRILFGVLRALCGELGIREGDAVRCRAATPGHLLLETPGGRTVTLERDWARFVQVVTPGSELPRMAGPRVRRSSGGAQVTKMAQ